MYEIDGITYADNDQKERSLPKAAQVTPLDGEYKLIVKFSDGEIKTFDCKPLFNYKVYEPLKDKNFFKSVYVAFGTVAWNDMIDIAPETLYLESVPNN
jgi:hypothetical protein